MNILEGLVKQKNLRNRLSYTLVLPSASDPEAYHAATFFTYDIHGNVDTLIQEYKGIIETGATDRFKQIVYDYDLISGKVNMVSYQPDRYNPALQLWEEQKDKFFHRYSYDAENRLILVETSRDKIIWEEDAQYSYYKHGPLARTVLGKQQVQGIDYAYTLQGWLKGVNSTTVSDGSFDIGKDGLPASPNSKVARDVVGFALHYYDAVSGSDTWLDYKPIIGSSAFARPGAVSNMVSIYNGNIAAMSVNNAGLLKAPAATTNAMPLFYNYRYDQLNRIVTMQAYKGLDAATNQWVPVAINDYKEAITYDPNGNILTYNRKGSPSIAGKQTEMDNLTYNYIANTNKLNYVADPTAVANYTEDIDAQTTGNYIYDAIGNLKRDIKEGIGTTTTDGIFWNVYGKITSIVKASSTITYTYDAAGNRISKTVSGGNTTMYVRDASGNVMSVYETPAGTAALKQKEACLYGSNRLGIAGEQTALPVNVNLSGGFGVAKLSVFARGEKSFELSNHLGNVLATVTDKKVAHDAGNGTIDYYNADVLSATDYAPFGIALVNRNWNSGNYRYGFNGKENDNEVKGEGNQQDYGFRIYDPRLGKFLSVDPLTKGYPWYTPYQFAGNKPINSIDLDGLEEYSTVEAYKKDKGSKALENMDGSDGAWLTSDRGAKNGVWSKAMETITKNNLKDKFHSFYENGSEIKELNFSFGIVKDYYNWVQKQVDDKGFGTRWAKGASYLVDELSENFDGGTLTSILYNDMGNVLKELNQEIAKFAVDKFRNILYGGEKVTNTSDGWYAWDADFVTQEQKTKVAPSVYSRYAGTNALNQLNNLARKEGAVGIGGSLFGKHYFPSFKTFGVFLNDPGSQFGATGRFNIPMLMLWPMTHQATQGTKLSTEQFKEIWKAHNAINSYYQNSMKY